MISAISLVPREILLYMFAEHLDLKTQAICCQVSKHWNFLNKERIKDIVAMAANINKKIPSYIGYNYLSEGKIVEQIKKTQQPETALIGEIASQNILKQHSINFNGTAQKIETITIEPIDRDQDLKAVVLEFDRTFSTKENVTLLAINKVTFILEVFWNKVHTNYNGNYTRLPASFNNYPVKYDIHTHSVYQRQWIKISKFEGTDSVYKALESAVKYINQHAPSSCASRPDGIFDAEVWSKSSLFGKNYTYI